MIIVEVPDEYLKKILGYGSSGAEIIDRSRNKKNIWKPLKTVVIFVQSNRVIALYLLITC